MTERKTPRFRRRLVSVAKNPSTALIHEQDVGVKWNVKRGCRSSHRKTLGCLCGVIVEDHVDYLARRDICFDRVQETNELLMPMALHAASDDLAFQHVQRREEGRRAVAFVIMGHGPARPFFMGRPGSCGQAPGFAIFVDREHDCMRRRIDIKADDIGEFFDEACRSKA